jgi:hypothetical protein
LQQPILMTGIAALFLQGFDSAAMFHLPLLRASRLAQRQDKR